MINKLIETISQVLVEVFEEAYPIYIEDVKDQITGPYFFLTCNRVTEVQVRKNRYRRTYEISIQFIPNPQKQSVEEINEIVEVLLNALESIEIEGQYINGTDRVAVVQEGILHFDETYAFDISKIEDEGSYMDALIWKGMRS